ncbi:MAG: aminotransferase class V-fold PLP-dependent enzyme [Chloroflexota bacterium]|nr:aminotransferase class V-fold PLP-dependent enzyme [Chloroflexota bacterium]
MTVSTLQTQTIYRNDTASLRAQFLLDPSVVFLNHGSFGACPKPVFETYQRWQVELERQPVRFIKDRLPGLMADARDALAEFIGAAAKDTVFVFNATAGVQMAANAIAASLRPGDEIVITDHEYHPCAVIWYDVAARTGARVVVAPVTLPFTDDDSFVEAYWSHVTPSTRVVFMSHVSSIAALLFPVEAIVERARAAGIISVIDGAHVPGQFPLHVESVGADFYTGNCHKWMCAPKASGFLCVAEPFQAAMRPLFLSWGWRDDADFTTRQHEQGTRDPAAILAVPNAIAFLRDHDWFMVRARCRDLLLRTRDRLHAISHTSPVIPASHIGQMASVPLTLPAGVTADALKDRLYDGYRIEIPVHDINGQTYIRVSIQGYNTESDADTLIGALEELLA